MYSTYITEITNKVIKLENGVEVNVNVLPEMYFKNKLTASSMFTCSR